MSFFDKKEEVINIELTQYGKHLLSKGKLRPKYYAFFDDGGIYDANATNFSESQPDIKTRIISETPMMKPVCNYMGVESQFHKRDHYTISGDLLYPTVDEKLNFLQYPLGTSSPMTDKAPAWNVVMIRGEMSSSEHSLTSSDYNELNIPQINCDVDYNPIKNRGVS